MNFLLNARWVQNTRRGLLPVTLAFALLTFVAISHASAKTPPGTGKLEQKEHPAVSVTFKLTGEYDAEARILPALLTVELDEEWKTYWRAPGEGGIKPTIDLAQSTGIKHIEWHWPTPTEYYVQGVRTAGYKNSVIFPLSVVLKPDITKAELNAVFTLSTCTDICVLTDFPLELTVDTSQLTPDERRVFEFGKAMSRVPQPIPGATITDARFDANNHRVSVTLENNNGWQSPQVFMDSDAEALDEVVFQLVSQSQDPQTQQLTAVFKTTHWLELPDLSEQPVTLTVNDGEFQAAYRETLTPAAIDSLPTIHETQELTLTTLLLALLAALVGGLILNVMPCVLPVLGIKIHSLINSSRISLAQVRRQFMATALGVIATFMLLGVVLALLKLTGITISWGMQFQNPWFIGVLALLTLLFALNLFGVFDVRLPSSINQWAAQETDDSLVGHFLQGVLATILATPCTAPFLGTAVAFALAAPIAPLLLVFLTLGIGMSLPWLLVAIYPKANRLLPKPGPWLRWIKPILGLFMLATTVWLVSLLWPIDASTTTAQRANEESRHWQSLSYAQITRHVANGNVVFVDVTADWCITCKANKYNVLLQDPVYTALGESDVIRMRGDWTRQNNYISDYLRAYGQYGVPYNRVYGPNRPEGIELPVILTDEAVMEAIDVARGK